MTDQALPSLSISIVHFDTSKAELEKVLTAIADALAYCKSRLALANADITIIDNSAEAALCLDDFTENVKRLAGLDYKLGLIQGQGNIGYGAAHNLAIEQARSTYHLILNPDVFIAESGLWEGLVYLEANKGSVALSPYASAERGEQQYLCKRYPSVFTFLLRGFSPNFIKELFSERLAKFEMRELPSSRPSSNIPIISGCFMLCRSSALKAVNGFDEKYFLYFEDFDLSLRLGKVGSLVFVPAIKIVHFGGGSAGKGLVHIKMFVRSGFTFFTKHGWQLA